MLGPPPVVRADTPPGRCAASLPLAADERVTWSRRMESRTLMRVSALVVLLGLGMALAVEPLVLAVLMLAALMTLRASCCGSRWTSADCPWRWVPSGGR